MILCDEIEIPLVLEGFVELDDVGVIQLSQNVDFIHEHFGISDHPFVDNLDDSVRVWRLFEFGLEDCAISTSSYRLSLGMFTLG
jgi:hypothetical protein